LDLWLTSNNESVWIENGSPDMVGATAFPTDVAIITDENNITFIGEIFGLGVSYESETGILITGVIAADGLSIIWTDGETTWTWSRESSCTSICGTGAMCKGTDYSY
jgi:hypothetical protein